MEPCESESKEVVKEIQFLAKKCGGRASDGVHPFPAHCNVTAPIASDGNERYINATMTLLMLKRVEKGAHYGNADDSSCSPLKLTPMSFMYFPYPKHADDGKGFGCVISLILLEKSRWLEVLHGVVSNKFPVDERLDNFVPHISLVDDGMLQKVWENGSKTIQSIYMTLHRHC